MRVDGEKISYQYAKFLLNGGVLGVAALILQSSIYRALGGVGALEYAMASSLTYVPLVFVNFAIQRKWVFSRSGLFFRFLAVNVSIMAFVASLSPLCKMAVEMFFAPPLGDRVGFVLASLFGSVPSFLAKRRFVFGVR